jgi:hypothetical protein
MHSRRFLPGYVLGLAALACCGSADAKGLYPTQFFTTLNSPETLVMADVNGDGFPDIVEIGADQTVAVLLNKGDGTFNSPSAYYVTGTTITSPVALAVADLNGDGIPDIVVVNNTGNTVAVLLGKGKGTFIAQSAGDAADGTGTPAPTYAVGGGAFYVAVADLNHDGIPDLVVANFTDDTVSILLGKGDGTFKDQSVIDVGLGPDFISIADLNNDGKPDLLVANSTEGTVEVLLGHGNGTFTDTGAVRASSPTSQSTLMTIAVADFNKDGNVDMVVTNSDGSSQIVTYMGGNGDGTFRAARGIVTGLQTLYLETADVDGDGNPDLIAGSFTNGTLRVLFGNGKGGFSSGRDYPANGLSTSSGAQAFALADVNGDGKPDIVTVNSTGGFVQVLYNDGNGRFDLSNSYDTGKIPTDVQAADLNGDGHADVVEINSADGTLGVLLGNGDGTLQPMQSYNLGADKHPQRLVLADVNGDGNLDAITANNGDGTVSVLLGNGDGTFQAARSFAAGGSPVDLAVADMDQDGKKDLVVGNAVINTVSILRGDGSGGFAAPVAYPASSNINALAVGDVNHDGFPDVVTVGGNVAVLRNDGKGGLLPIKILNSGGSLDVYVPVGVRVMLKDVNHDNNPDILVVDKSNSQLVVLLGNHLGYFTRVPNSYPTCANPGNLAAKDLNGDGDIDVVVTCSGSNTLGVMLGNGQGTFINSSYATEIDPRGVAVADFDEDGTPDLVTVNGGSDNLNVLLQIHGIVAADHAPKAIDSLFSIDDGATVQVGLFEGTDADGDSLAFTLLNTNDPNASVGATGNGVFSYFADVGFTGGDLLQFQASDGVKLSNVGTVTVFVHKNSAGQSKGGRSFLGGFYLPLLPLLLGLLARRRRRR